jgi:FkbM family methyltransferase
MQFQFSRYVLFCLCLALISGRGLCEDTESPEHNSETVEEEEHATETKVDHNASSIDAEEDEHTEKMTTDEEERATETEVDHNASPIDAEEDEHTEKITAEEERATETEAEEEVEEKESLTTATEESDHLEESAAKEEHLSEPESEPEDNEYHDDSDTKEESSASSETASHDDDSSIEHSSEPESDKGTEKSVPKPEPSKIIKTGSVDSNVEEPNNLPKESFDDSLDRSDDKINKAETENPKKQEKQEAQKTRYDNVNAAKPVSSGKAVNDGDEDAENGSVPVAEECEEVIAPLYNKLVPIRGWDRYSGDSAKNISQWFRWWKYLSLRKPVLMLWINGLTLKIYPKNEIGRALFVSGMYDPNNLVVVSALLKNGDIFIDAGANMGYSSLLMATVVGETGHVYALEPSKRDCKRLEDNIELNGLGSTVSHYPYALADVKGSATLQIASEERNALNTLGNEFSVKGVEKVSTETVDTITLDEFVEEEEIRKVDVLKLDIEGSELKALAGAKKTIQKYKPAIMLGVNIAALKASGADVIRIEQLLRELDYCIYKLVDTPFMLEKIENIADSRSQIVFCLHSSVQPPKLPQPKRFGIAERIVDFFR